MSYGQDSQEKRLYDAPTDSVSGLQFSSDGRKLLCSAWDSKLRLYDVKSGHIDCDFQSQAPLLDAAFESDDYAWSGGLARKVIRYNIDRRSEEVVGTHDEAVNCVLKSREHNLIITGTKKHYFTEYIFKNFRKLGSRGINLGPTRKTSKSCQSTTDRTRLCYRYCRTQISRRNGSKKNFDLGSEKLR